MMVRIVPIFELTNFLSVHIAGMKVLDLYIKSFKIINTVLLIKLNLWLTAPEGATQVNQTSATDWQMAARRDNVIIPYYNNNNNNNNNCNNNNKIESQGLKVIGK